MKKYIKIGDTQQFEVPEIYPYTYDGGLGKLVLRIVVDPSVKSYEELFTLLNNNSVSISEYWENEMTGEKVLKAEYTGYCKDYKCSYNGDSEYPNMFFIELTRKTATELQAEENQNLIAANNAMLLGLFEAGQGGN